MTDPKAISLQALRSLAANPANSTPPRIWRALTSDERAAATEQLLLDKPEARQAIVQGVAQARHFRESTVRAWPDEKLASAFALVPLRNTRAAQDLLQALHVPGRAGLLQAFFDGLGIPNEDGLADAEALDSIEPNDDDLAAASSAAVSGTDERQAITFLLALSHERTRLGTRVQTWLAERFSAGSSGLAVDGPELEEGAIELNTSPEDVESFTTLDRQLIFAVVDCAQGIEGAPDADQVDDLIAEVLQLNSHRHRSYFHAGFRDVLFERQLEGPGREENVSRARWYWAGVIQGYARSQRWPLITDLMSDNPIVQTLGDGADGASRAAAPHMIRALFAVGRPSEVPRFLDRQALLNWPELFPMLVDEGSKVLRENRASEVKGTFDLLAEVMDSLDDPNDLLEIPSFREARRRHAHCLRQLGEFVRARALIENLLANGPGPNEKAMLLADLGLIEGRFRRLADVKLPASTSDCEIVLEALGRGEERFEEASRLDVPYSAHARLCLGVLHLGDARHDEATDELEQARAVFLARPDRYASGDLIETTELCLGIAQVLALRTERMGAAATMIANGLEAGLSFPQVLLPDTLEALGLASQQAQLTVAGALISRHGQSVLDAIASSHLPRLVPEIADALLERADGDDRTSDEIAADLRSTLGILLAHQRFDEAAAVLDRLEELAVAGVATSEFAALLETPANFEPVWSREDAVLARAHVLESLGRYEDAGNLIIEACHRALSSGRDEALEDAAQMLASIKSLGLGKEFTKSLEARLSAMVEEEMDAAPHDGEVERRPARVLVVGGDERQSKSDRAIARTLKERAPHIEVVFLRTGWSGNWAPHVDAFRREVGSCDAVVLMRFIRTEFGRQVRRLCEVPWRLCWGAGREQAVRAIMTAADAAAAR